MKKLIALALAVMVMVSLTACGAATESGDAAVMPASSDHLEGEDSQDVVTSLRPAGLTDATSTTAGLGLELTIIDVTSPVSPGSSATVKVKTAPGADCSIAVEYKSGRSKAKGLDSKKADAAGDVSWTWVVGSNTSSGRYPITVTASMDGQSVTEETTFVVK